MEVWVKAEKIKNGSNITYPGCWIRSQCGLAALAVPADLILGEPCADSRRQLVGAGSPIVVVGGGALWCLEYPRMVEKRVKKDK